MLTNVFHLTINFEFWMIEILSDYWTVGLWTLRNEQFRIHFSQKWFKVVAKGEYFSRSNYREPTYDKWNKQVSNSEQKSLNKLDHIQNHGMKKAPAGGFL